MKLVIIALSFTLFLSMSCKKRVYPRRDLCDGVACTENYAMVTVDVVNRSGGTIYLDKIETIHKRTGQLIKSMEGRSISPFQVLGDDYAYRLRHETDSFLFKGYINDSIVVDEVYVITADCCHIAKSSGAEKVVLDL